MMQNPSEGIHRYGWSKSPPYPADARGPFEGTRCTCQPMTRAAFLAAVERWNQNGNGWRYWPLPADADKPAPSYFDHHNPDAPFPHYNPARDGWTVKALAEYLTSYATRHPNAVVRFTSSECGGRWPDAKAPMGVFTDHQVCVVDGSRVGEGITLNISLLRCEKNPVPARWPGQPGTL